VDTAKCFGYPGSSLSSIEEQKASILETEGQFGAKFDLKTWKFVLCNTDLV
jgi:hypothetical protein